MKAVVRIQRSDVVLTKQPNGTGAWPCLRVTLSDQGQAALAQRVGRELGDGSVSGP